MRIRTILLTGALALAAALPAAAGWQADISPFDRQRLAHIDASRDRALGEAEHGGSRADLAKIHEALRGARGDITAHELTGTWRCRNLKLGGMAPTKTYAWFTCRVRHSRSGLFFEKLGGVQRVSGYLDRYDSRGWVLLGAMSYMHERQQPYSGGAPGAGAQTTSNDMVGLVSKMGRNHVRIEFPDPVVESHFEIIEMKR